MSYLSRDLKGVAADIASPVDSSLSSLPWHFLALNVPMCESNNKPHWTSARSRRNWQLAYTEEGARSAVLRDIQKRSADRRSFTTQARNFFLDAKRAKSRRLCVSRGKRVTVWQHCGMGTASPTDFGKVHSHELRAWAAVIWRGGVLPLENYQSKDY